MASIKTINVEIPQTQDMVFDVLGITPYIYHAISEKAKQQLLFPTKKTKGEQAVSLKHNPFNEYRDSIYYDNQGRMVIPGRQFKSAMSDVAKRVGGKTAEVRQVLQVKDEMCLMFGLPQLFMSVVKNSGFNAAPDIRTRAIVPKWAATIHISFIYPILDADQVCKLLVSAGLLNGVGDYRAQKGAGDYGSFKVVTTDEDKEEFEKLKRESTHENQVYYLDNPFSYDNETSKLLHWYEKKVGASHKYQDQLESESSKKNGSSKKNNRKRIKVSDDD